MITISFLVAIQLEIEKVERVIKSARTQYKGEKKKLRLQRNEGKTKDP
jgi:hypothetical protein